MSDLILAVLSDSSLRSKKAAMKVAADDAEMFAPWSGR